MSIPTPSSPTASALALREFFGDRKPPEISRKITACVACRKLKIKCHMQDSRPPCTRCKRRDLTCTVNHSLQMLLENDVTWKRSIEQKLQLMEEQIANISNATATNHAPASTGPEATPTAPSTSSATLYELHSGAHGETHSNSDTDAGADNAARHQPGWEVVMDARLNPAAMPASCVSQVPDTSPSGQLSESGRQNDLISRGAIALDMAEQFFEVYKKLDHYVYGILADHDTLSSIRAGSSLLTAAVCAVAALHSSSPGYAASYDEFVREFAAQSISRNHTLDDVRGLCIGAFWLSDMSWTLAATSARIAIEMNLHRGVSKAKHTCFDKPMADRISCYVRTRLYLIVYVCDHHFSIAYGRAPMTREFTALIAPRAFHGMEHANTPDDFRLVAQVELWSVLSRVYDTFGVNTDMAIPAHQMSEFRRLGVALESWRIDAYDKLPADADTKSIDVGLHAYFAKLYLCTHAFRGVTRTSAVPQDMEEFADAAVYTGHSLLRSLVVNPDLQMHFQGLPTYFATMVAASFVFLLKMTIKRPANVRFNRDETCALLRQASDVLIAISRSMHSQHVLYSIAVSIAKLVNGVPCTNTNPPSSATGMDSIEVATQDPTLDASNPLISDDMSWLQDGDFGIDWFEFDQALHNT
ncbi:uncharacterized protein SPSK_07222 [Sporothrix schenckii 1099-18]|uniref:Zn(2)-C6 fungal-type domain-containing protein n=1 Tax=Sporothrix schenckii 1099-18 TaxID=1397361 RepID=A0A0F2MIB2_SPOSC|nr:uncharacterized protein SPSK_07222 [Sporothrix schenckii 1099-18]KJR88575.1 hypothetical protein SPSK_07222 [Sporothrix schenckii 1099-18]